MFILEDTEYKYTVKNLFVTSLEIQSTIDIILTVSKEVSGKTIDTTFFYFSDKEKKERVFESKHHIEGSPIVIADLNGDRKIDVLFYANSKRQFVYFENKSPVIKDFDELSDQDSNCKQDKFNVPLTNRGNAFIDIDSNCRNDLLLTSKTEAQSKDGKFNLEIWHGKIVDEAIKYCLVEIFELTDDYGAFSLGDFNDDGYIDLIFPHLDSGKVTILFNQHRPSFYWTQDFCEIHENDTIPSIVYDFTNKSALSHFDLNENGKEYKFYYNPEVSSTILRVASFDSEPYPGLLVVMETNKINNVFLFENSLRLKEHSTSGTEKIFTLTKQFEIPDALYASFFDFDENGILDVFIVNHDKTTNIKRSIGYFNNIQKDNFFLKGQTKLDIKKFYASEIGTHYRFIATNNDGSRRMDFTYQLIQNSDLTMSLPYSLAGIGRSNNYIENYQVVSATLDKKSNRENLTPIIPNSQLIITKKIEADTIVWVYDLIVQPMDKLVMMIIIIAMILVVILVVIIILHLREKKEDKKLQENEKFSAWFA